LESKQEKFKKNIGVGRKEKEKGEKKNMKRRKSVTPRSFSLSEVRRRRKWKILRGSTGQEIQYKLNPKKERGMVV
jgi:hypothetical protein